MNKEIHNFLVCKVTNLRINEKKMRKEIENHLELLFTELSRSLKSHSDKRLSDYKN